MNNEFIVVQKSKTFNIGFASGKPLIRIKNSIGPSMEPSGNPLAMFSKLEQQFPILTNCFLTSQYECKSNNIFLPTSNLS